MRREDFCEATDSRLKITSRSVFLGRGVGRRARGERASEGCIPESIDCVV